jgi:hypothetical protein
MTFLLLGAGKAAAVGGGGGGSRYWRLLVSHTSVDNSTNIAEVQLRESAGGSDVTGSGTASGLGTPITGTAASAFDNNASTTYHSEIGTMPTWLQYDFGSGQDKAIVEVVIQAHPSNPAYSPTDFDVQFSSNGSSWTTSWSVTGSTGWAAGETRTFTKP